MCIVTGTCDGASDDFITMETGKYQQCGNSVTDRVSQWAGAKTLIVHSSAVASQKG